MNRDNSYIRVLQFMDLAFIILFVVILCLVFVGVNRVIVFSLCGIAMVLRLFTYFLRWKILKGNKNGR